MDLDVASAKVIDVYHLLVDVVAPRPIAWVTTVDIEGRPNLAPFSFFNAFGANPPVVVFSPTLRRDGGKKDTLLNIEATGEFVVNAATSALAERVNLTSKEVPPGENEIDLAGLRAAPSVKVRPPRVLESPVQLECKVLQVLPIGAGPIAANLVIGQIVFIHLDDSILGPDGRVDPRKLQSVARLGGDYWCHASDLFTQKRP